MEQIDDTVCDMAAPEQHNLLQQLEKQASEDKDTQCGVPCLQRLASKKTFVLVYGCIGMSYFGLGTYGAGTISSMEKQFRIPSRVSGIISSASDMSSVFAGILLAYLGRQGHKPRWVGIGTALVALSCAMRVLPYLLHGVGEDALSLTREYGATSAEQHSTSVSVGPKLCGYTNSSSACFEDTSSLSSVSIMFVAQLVMGVGTSVYYTLGISFLDDNVSKDKAPFLIGITQCLRLIGPTFGSMLASYCLSLYVDPYLTPTITRNDPRWIGAWWLGWIPFSAFTLFLAILIFMFPKVLPREALRRAATETARPANETSSFDDFKRTIRKLLRNKVLMYNSMAQVFYWFGLVGLWGFMPKYMETQFYKSASTANFVSGSVGLVFTALGVLASTLVITRFQPRTSFVTGWNVFVESLDLVGSVLYASIDCPGSNVPGHALPDGTLNLTLTCNADCECPSSQRYSPVCETATNTTHFSACHAGCRAVSWLNSTASTVFSECTCTASPAVELLDGPCPVDCDSAFLMFVIVVCVLRFTSASGRAGNTLLHFRCVDAEDKPLAIGIAEFMLSLLAFIPAPIFFGILIDWSCKVWGQTCDGTGNCWLYDGYKLRMLVNLTSGAFMAVGTLLDVGVWYHSRDLNLYEDHDDDVTHTQEQNTKLEMSKL